MAAGHIMMAMTLDGFVARADHSLDWLMKQPTQDEDHGFKAFQDSVDVIVMGSGSYRTVMGFDAWPYTKPVIVLSRSMSRTDIPDALQGRLEVCGLDPVALMDDLATRGMARAYIDGGAIIRSFMAAGLIMDMRVTVVPMLIGQGIRLFGEIPADIDLELVGATPYPSGLVDLEYRVIASGA